MNNGRVNIMGRNPVDRFNLYEKTIPSKPTSYKDALVGNFQDSILSKVFFQQKIFKFYKMLFEQVYIKNQIIIIKYVFKMKMF